MHNLNCAVRQNPQTRCIYFAFTFGRIILVARISPAAEAKHVFVCLFVRHACERQSLCARFLHERVQCRNSFDAVG